MSACRSGEYPTSWCCPTNCGAPNEKILVSNQDYSYVGYSCSSYSGAINSNNTVFMNMGWNGSPGVACCQHSSDMTGANLICQKGQKAMSGACAMPTPISGNTDTRMFTLQPGLTKQPGYTACTKYQYNTGGNRDTSPDNTGTAWGCTNNMGCYNASGITENCPNATCNCSAGQQTLSGSDVWINWQTCCPANPANGSYTTSLPDPSVCKVVCNSGYTWDGTACQPPAAPPTSTATPPSATGTPPSASGTPPSSASATTSSTGAPPPSTGTPPSPPAPPSVSATSTGTPSPWNPKSTKCTPPNDEAIVPVDITGKCPPDSQRFRNYCGNGFYCVKSSGSKSSNGSMMRDRALKTSDY